MKHTKDQLEAMSDTELNRVVAVIAGYGADYLERNPDNAPDYCNKHSEMMPLAFECAIELSPLFRGGWVASEVSSYTHEEDPIYNENQASHTNPLRACAIVYVLARKV